MGALFFRPEQDGGFQESSAEMTLTFFSAGVCPRTFVRFGDMFVLQSSRYSSSGTSSETTRTGAAIERFIYGQEDNSASSEGGRAYTLQGHYCHVNPIGFSDPATSWRAPNEATLETVVIFEKQHHKKKPCGARLLFAFQWKRYIFTFVVPALLFRPPVAVCLILPTTPRSFGRKLHLERLVVLTNDQGLERLLDALAIRQPGKFWRSPVAVALPSSRRRGLGLRCFP